MFQIPATHNALGDQLLRSVHACTGTCALAALRAYALALRFANGACRHMA